MREPIRLVLGPADQPLVAPDLRTASPRSTLRGVEPRAVAQDVVREFVRDDRRDLIVGEQREEAHADPHHAARRRRRSARGRAPARSAIGSPATARSSTSGSRPSRSSVDRSGASAGCASISALGGIARARWRSPRDSARSSACRRPRPRASFGAHPGARGGAARHDRLDRDRRCEPERRARAGAIRRLVLVDRVEDDARRGRRSRGRSARWRSTSRCAIAASRASTLRTAAKSKRAPPRASHSDHRAATRACARRSPRRSPHRRRGTWPSSISIARPCASDQPGARRCRGSTPARRIARRRWRAASRIASSSSPVTMRLGRRMREDRAGTAPGWRARSGHRRAGRAEPRQRRRPAASDGGALRPRPAAERLAGKRRQQRVLVGEMPVDRGRADPDGARDLAQRQLLAARSASSASPASTSAARKSP